jgi:hypothetical protein
VTVRQYFRLLKPYLYVAALFFAVDWGLSSHWLSIPSAIVGVPVLVALYVYKRLAEALNTYAKATGFVLDISLLPKLSAHPYLAAAAEAAKKKMEEMNAAGGRDEWDGLLRSTTFGFSSHCRALYHHGLVWSHRDKSFWRELYVEGRPYGAALDGPDSDLEPSVVLNEKYGVLTVLLVPIQRSERGYFGTTRREASIRRAVQNSERELLDRLLQKNGKKPMPKTDADDQPGDPPAVVLARFPVRHLMTLMHAPDSLLGISEWVRTLDSLRKEYALTPEERDSEFHSDWWTWENEYISFRFMNFAD